jgi:CheY-like chemotaxis protein
MKIKVIVVEDNRDKLAKILIMLRENVGTLIDEPVIARDAKEAKAALKDASFDLMLLDLSIPRDPEGAPLTGGGVELLKEIRERDLYSVPKEVVGLTAFRICGTKPKVSSLKIFGQSSITMQARTAGLTRSPERLGTSLPRRS